MSSVSLDMRVSPEDEVLNAVSHACCSLLVTCPSL